MSALARETANGLARAVALAGLFSCALTAVAFFLSRVWWPFELTTHFTWYYAAALAPAVALWLAPSRFRRRRLGAVGAVALAWNLALLAPLYWRPHAPPTRGDAFCVMTLNVHTSNRRYEDVLRLVRSQQPDALLLLEVDRRWTRALAPLAEDYPVVLEASREDNFGLAYYARAADGEPRVLELGGAEVPSVAARVPVGGRVVTVLGTHPLPPIGAENAGLRDEQLADAAAWVAQQEGPALLVGDLNVTPWSPAFWDLLGTSGLVDSARGFGLRSTWFPGARWLGLPIDHVLHNSALVAANRRIGPDVGSDHRAVLVDFAFADK